MRSRGFTLIEVLVALAIFVMAAVLLAGAYLNVLNSYDAIGKSADQDDDLKFARMAILTEPDLETAEKGGDFESANGRRVHWKATIEPTLTADLFRVTFECTLDSLQPSASREPQRVVQSFQVLRPTWSKPDERAKLRSDANARILKLQSPSHT